MHNLNRMTVRLAAWALLVLVATLGSSPAAAQDPPQFLKIQGFLSDKSGGTPVPVTGFRNMTFRLCSMPAGENCSSPVGPIAVEVVDGFYDTEVALLPSAFTGSDWWLEVIVEPETLDKRIHLGSTPFAYFADQLDGFEAADLAKVVDLSDHEGNSDAHREHASLEESTEIDDAIADHEAAVDTHAGMYLSIEGGTLTGRLDIIDGAAEGTTGSLRLDPAAGTLELSNAAGTTTVEIDAEEGWANSPHLILRDSSGNQAVRLGAHGTQEYGGQLQLNGPGATTQKIVLSAEYEPGGSAALDMFTTGATPKIRLLAGTQGGAGSVLNMASPTDATTVTLQSDDGGGGALSLRNSSGAETIFLQGREGIDESGSAILRNANAVDTVDLDADDGSDSGRLILRDDGGTSTVQLDAKGSPAGAWMALRNGAGHNTFFVDTEAGDGGAGMTLQDGNDNTAIELDAVEGAGAVIRMRDTVNDRTTILLSAEYELGGGAALDMFTTGATPKIRLLAGTQGGVGSVLSMASPIDATTVTLQSDDGGGGALSLRNSSGAETLFLQGREGADESGSAILRNANAVDTVDLDADGGSDSGVLKLRDEDGTATVVLDAKGSPAGGWMVLKNGAGHNAFFVDTEAGGGGVGMTLQDGNDNTAIELDAVEGAGPVIRLRDTANNRTTILLDAVNSANGQGRVITDELEITGGADLSEQFDVADVEGRHQAGMLVVIDPRHPGRLRISEEAYDTKVAGVLSGAGGIRPGLLMGQRDSTADGDHPIALAGRVYAWADSSNGPIEPGDLLTTSDTPGHAMRVSDHARAHGAIIGKAMTGLDHGQGLVLVLVSLQ